MAKKIIKRNKKTLNLFDLGGTIETSATGIQSLIDDYNKASQVKRVDVNTPSFQGDSNSLMKQWGNYVPTSTEGIEKSTSSKVGDTAKSTLTGASTGAAIGTLAGPIGTVIGAGVGAAVGLGTGIAGWVAGDDAAKKEEERIKRLNDYNAANFSNSVNNLNQSNNLLAAANYSAYGGKLLGEGGNLYDNIPNEGTHGGNFTNGVTLIDSGGTHEQNPLSGVPMGIAKDGQPNLVEEGEVKYNDYIFSNRLNPDKKLLDLVKLPSTYSNKTFARIAEDMNKESSERPNDPISRNGLKNNMTKLQMLQEVFKQMQQQKDNKTQNKQFAKGGRLNNVHYGDNGLGLNMIDYANEQNLNKGSSLPFGDFNSINNIQRPSNDLSSIQSINGAIPSQTEGVQFPSIGMNELESRQGLLPQSNLKGVNFNQSNNPVSPTLWDTIKSKAHGMDASNLRYVPALGGAIGSFTDMIGKTNKPNYDAANMLGNFANSIPEVSAKPIGNYMQYTPLDRDYYLNKLNAQSAATRANILNTSGGNRANAQANLLAADYNAQNSIGNLGRQAEEYNLNQRMQVENFNRGTNQFNSEQDMKAAGINRGNDQLRLKAKSDQASLMTEANNRSSVGKSANLTNLFESLGGIGKEQYSRNTILSNPALYYSIGQNGKISYKNGYEGLSPEAKKEVDNHIKSNENVKAKGGYLSKKNSLNINI